VAAESLAVCAVRAGDFERAAKLHGLATYGWFRFPSVEPWLLSYDLNDLLAPAREALGEGRYLELFETGKAMPLEEAIALATRVQVG